MSKLLENRMRRELSFGEILGKSFNLYRSRFIQFLIPYVIVVFLSSLVNYMITSSVTNTRIFPPTGLAFLIILGATSIIVNWILEAGVEGLIVIHSSKIIEKGQADLNESFSQALDRLVPLLTASFASIILVLVGIICLAIPGIIIAVMFSLIVPVIMIEKTAGLDSLRRSRKLVRKRWEKTFAVMLILVILQLIVNTIVGWIIPDLGLSTSIIVNLVTALVKPLMPIATVFLYHSMLQKERLLKMMPDTSTLRYCPQCGKPVFVSSIFCQNCGFKQPTIIKEDERQETVVSIEQEKNTEHIYNQLLSFYSTKSSQPKRFLDYEIENLMKKGLIREEAIKHLAIKERIIEE